MIMPEQTRKEKLEVFCNIIKENPEITQREYDALKFDGKPGRMLVRRIGFESWDDAKRFALAGDQEIVLENIKIAKQRQKFMDSNRIERKAFREYARIENALEALTLELIELLKAQSFQNNTEYHKYAPKINGAAGIVQISDTHFNELVELQNNTYDFPIASKRMRKYANRARTYFKAFGVKNLLIAMTGDILNSDRRLDEKLNQSTNRTKAMFLATKILTQFILDLNKDFNITVTAVSGNESRIMDESGNTDILITDNYDYSIFMLLKYLLESKGIQFYQGQSFSSLPINIAGKCILLCHGVTIPSETERKVHQLMGQWSDKGYKIDYVIFGHLHAARIGDTHARCSSLTGQNAYSEDGLGLIGKASQNIFVIHGDGSLDGIKVDLQNTDGWTGYPIEEELASYNAKSASKLRGNKTILEITI